METPYHSGLFLFVNQLKQLFERTHDSKEMSVHKFSSQQQNAFGADNLHIYSWFSRDVWKKLRLKILSFYLLRVKDVLKIYLLTCFQLGGMLCFENRAVWISIFFYNAWHLDCFWQTCHVQENIDSPCVFEFWIINMTRKVSTRMFWSLLERRNVLREPK